jgi:hypothetical protein
MLPQESFQPLRLFLVASETQLLISDIHWVPSLNHIGLGCISSRAECEAEGNLWVKIADLGTLS